MDIGISTHNMINYYGLVLFQKLTGITKHIEDQVITFRTPTKTERFG